LNPFSLLFYFKVSYQVRKSSYLFAKTMQILSKLELLKYLLRCLVK
jgi:hypothetical protein